jgi:hypothetical protein
VVESGSYTGNGTTNRTIALAFTPKLVVVVCETASSPMYFSDISTGLYGWQILSSAAASKGSNFFPERFPRVTTNGFIVSGNAANDTNQNTRVFHYFAFG